MRRTTRVGSLIIVTGLAGATAWFPAVGDDTPATVTTRPAASSDEMVEPDDLIDPELVEQLSGGGTTARDSVESTLDQMKSAAIRLRDQYDAGPMTQRLQERAIAGIDQMITAAEQSASSPKQASRRRSTAKPRRAEQKGEQSREKSTDGAANQKGGGTTEKSDGRVEKQAKDAERADLARRWGFLPEQDRDAVLEGFDEDFMPRYRDEILRYYRNLSVEASRE